MPATNPASPSRRAVPRPFELHWGSGHIVEEASYAGEHHEPALQLLEFDDGSLSMRLCYYDHEGRFQRSPLILSQSEIDGLHAALQSTPRLHQLLRQLVS